MMEAARTSETLVNFYQTAHPEDSHLNTILGFRKLNYELERGILQTLALLPK
jgi:hypothetical protein